MQFATVSSESMILPNAVVGWLAVLRIQVIAGSNTDLETGCLEWNVEWFSTNTLQADVGLLHQIKPTTAALFFDAVTNYSCWKRR